jgi:hypothetical protein
MHRVCLLPSSLDSSDNHKLVRFISTYGTCPTASSSLLSSTSGTSVYTYTLTPTIIKYDDDDGDDVFLRLQHGKGFHNLRVS